MSDAAEKTCTKCGVVKSLADFGSDRHKKDGKTSACRPCVNAQRLKSWYANYDENRRRQREHLYDPGRKEKRLIAARLHQLRHPEKAKARSDVNRAIRDGKLARQPCEKCGALRANAHHEDYSRPLEVHWMCSRCHGIEHRQSAEGKAQAQCPR